jgi:hypothetical protein
LTSNSDFTTIECIQKKLTERGLVVKLFISILLSFVCFSAIALTPKEAEKFKEWQDYLKDPKQSYSERVKTNCGYEIPITIEEKFVTPFMTANTSAPAYCDATRSAIASLCKRDVIKPYVVRNIKKIDCKLGKEKEIGFKLAGGTFTFTVGLHTPNLDEKVKEYLENNMK